VLLCVRDTHKEEKAFAKVFLLCFFTRLRVSLANTDKGSSSHRDCSCSNIHSKLSPTDNLVLGSALGRLGNLLGSVGVLGAKALDGLGHADLGGSQ